MNRMTYVRPSAHVQGSERFCKRSWLVRKVCAAAFKRELMNKIALHCFIAERGARNFFVRLWHLRSLFLLANMAHCRKRWSRRVRPVTEAVVFWIVSSEMANSIAVALEMGERPKKEDLTAVSETVRL